MKHIDRFCLKTVRWSSWPLLALMAVFFVTGYAMSGRFGFGSWMDEDRALAIHKLLHLPLLVLTLVHSAPAVYMSIKRWRRNQ